MFNFKHFLLESKKKRAVATQEDLWNCFEGILELEDLNGCKLAFNIHPLNGLVPPRYTVRYEIGSFEVHIIRPYHEEDSYRQSSPFILTQDMFDEISSSIGKSQGFNLQLASIDVSVQTSRKGSYDSKRIYNISQLEDVIDKKVANFEIRFIPK